jgi:hypothetical protein
LFTKQRNVHNRPCIYEKQSSALVLTEATLAGAVLKNTGSNLETGELHFALTDHLGNVRVSFKKPPVA